LVALQTWGRTGRPPTTDVVDVAPGEPTSYTVRPGDSLWRIAERHLGHRATTTATAQEVARLWEINQQRIGTGNPDLIFPGQTLRV
jgi:nucleoid-associated protein YgaU